ncbi:MAG: response regulator [Bryobacteraceae bacterium]|nr:response regulator [Bryobacteraceae bacterium]
MKALIVDDERLARRELQRLLEAHAQVEIVGEAANAEEARRLIAEQKPELLFLDIQMPGESGFDLLASLERAPEVIFTTAFDQYALRAFEVSALDYLMKPVEPERLAAAIAKVRKKSEEERPARKPADQVFVKDGDRCWFVRLQEIGLLESEGNYTRLYFGKERPLIPRSLAQLEEKLDTDVFFRASRKHIINLRWIEQVDTAVNGALVAKLRGGHEIEMSRRQSQRFKESMAL